MKKRISSFDEWMDIVTKERALLLFVQTEKCSVCEGLYPQVLALQTDSEIPFYNVNAVEVPEIAGQLMLFTAPVVLLFNEGQEYVRFARFVRMEELKRRLEEIQ